MDELWPPPPLRKQTSMRHSPNEQLEFHTLINQVLFSKHYNCMVLLRPQCHVTMWTCSPPWGGEHPSEIKRIPETASPKVPLERFKVILKNKLPVQFTNSFCNRQQLFPLSCLFFITAKLFLASSLKGRVRYIPRLVMIYVDEVQAGRHMEKKIIHHSITVMSPAAGSDTCRRIEQFFIYPGGE